MMDEAEEEALFERLRRGLEALRRNGGAAPVEAPRTGPDGELVAAVARVEAGVRTLAIRHDAAARHADALEESIEARIEAAVARTTAVLRAELDRLAARLSSAAIAPRQPRRRSTLKTALLGLFVLALVAAGTAVMPFAGPFDAGPLGRTLAGKVADWRAALEAQLPSRAGAEKGVGATADPVSRPPR